MRCSALILLSLSTSLRQRPAAGLAVATAGAGVGTAAALALAAGAAFRAVGQDDLLEHVWPMNCRSANRQEFSTLVL